VSSVLTLLPGVQDDAEATDAQTRVRGPVPQRRVTARLRTDVVEHYERGMSSRRVAATFGLGRTTVFEILKTAGVDVRTRGRKY
jgi:CENP-B N-terminal DNA-binding domain